MIRPTLFVAAVVLTALLASAAGAVANPALPSATAKDLTVRFDAATHTFKVSHREAGDVLTDIVVRAKVGGREIASNSERLEASIVPAGNVLKVTLEQAFTVSAEVTDDGGIEIIVEGPIQGDVTFQARAGVGAKAAACFLKDEAEADQGVLVTTLGPAAIAAAPSIFDPEKDLALSVGPAGRASWQYDGGWQVRSSGPAGQPLVAIRVLPHYYRDTLGIEFFSARQPQKRWPTAPVVAMTWYGIEAMKGRPAQTMERLKPEIDWVARNLAPYVGDNLVFQLDDNYPEKDDKVMRELADTIRAAGLVPGIWFAPHGVAPAGEAEKHPDWFLRDADGKLLACFAGICYETLAKDKGYKRNYILNTENPEAVKAWFGLWWHKASETWNYDFFKIDGETYVAESYRKSANGGGAEGFRRGMAAARAIVGPEKFINMCMGPVLDAVGIADGSRTGGDTGYHPHAMGVLLRWNFLNNFAWWCDPDAAASLYKPAATVERVRLNAQGRALTGQQFLTDDLWTQMPPEKVRVWQQSFPMLDIRPANLYEIKDWSRYDHIDLKIARPWGRWDVVGLFNYGGSAVEKPLNLARLQLPAKAVHVYDFWRGAYLGRFAGDAKISQSMAPFEGRAYAVVPAADDGRPVLLSTSRHISQGGLDVEAAEWKRDGRRWTVAGKSSHLVKGDPYELAFAAGGQAEVSAKSSAGAMKLSRAGGVVRAVFTPTADKADWEVVFEPAKAATPELIPARLDVPAQGKVSVTIQNAGPKAAPVTLKSSDPRVRLENPPAEAAAGAAASVGIAVDTAGMEAGQVLAAQIILESPGRPAEKTDVLVRVPAPPSLAGEAKPKGSTIWDPGFDPAKLIDGDTTTRWNAGGGQKDGAWVELEWEKPVTFVRVVVDEWVEKGERIQAWQLLAGDKDFKEIARGDRMGRKHEIRLPVPVEARRLRLLIEKASAEPSITEIEVHGPGK